MEKVVACIDIKAFYSAVECVDRGLDPFKTPLVVCDTERSMGTIVLSVTPYLRTLGIPSRLRRRELPHINGMIYATPRMQKYIDVNCQIISILLDFVAEEDLHIYSIDESFINLGPYLALYNKSADEIVAEIQKRIYDETGLTATAGISYNIFMAKVALDNEGKNLKPHYRTTWTKEDVEKKLWKVHPIEKLWGISHGYKRSLEAIGIDTVEKLAKAPVEYLKFKFGVIGEQLHQLANGIDESDIREKYIPMATSFSAGQTLFEDYGLEETKVLLREVCDDLCKRLHKNKKATKSVSLAILYNYESEIPGFSKQIALDAPTDQNEVLYKAVLEILNDNIKNIGVRKVYISFNKLSDAEFMHQSLFEDNDKAVDNREINLVMEQIQEKYGQESISRTSSLLDKSMFKTRARQIGGHRK